jgi:hypothetical protein
MAIQPIDLQTLFTQMDKVAKTQSEAKEGAQLQQAMQGAAQLKKQEERVKSVKQAPSQDDGTEKVKDREPRRDQNPGDGKPAPKSDEPAPDKDESEVVRDPRLGRIVDISG